MSRAGKAAFFAEKAQRQVVRDAAVRKRNREPKKADWAEVRELSQYHKDYMQGRFRKCTKRSDRRGIHSLILKAIWDEKGVKGARKKAQLTGEDLRRAWAINRELFGVGKTRLVNPSVSPLQTAQKKAKKALILIDTMERINKAPPQGHSYASMRDNVKQRFLSEASREEPPLPNAELNRVFMQLLQGQGTPLRAVNPEFVERSEREKKEKPPNRPQARFNFAFGGDKESAQAWNKQKFEQSKATFDRILSGVRDRERGVMIPLESGMVLERDVDRPSGRIGRDLGKGVSRRPKPASILKPGPTASFWRQYIRKKIPVENQHDIDEVQIRQLWNIINEDPTVDQEWVAAIRGMVLDPVGSRKYGRLSDEQLSEIIMNFSFNVEEIVRKLMNKNDFADILLYLHEAATIRGLM